MVTRNKSGEITQTLKYGIDLFYEIYTQKNPELNEEKILDAIEDSLSAKFNKDVNEEY